MNGDYDCNFFVIYPTKGLGLDKVRVGFSLTTWDNSDIAGHCNFEWDGVDSVALNDCTSLVSTEQVDSMDTGDSAPNGEDYTDSIELDYDSRDFGGYSYTKISFEHLQPASFVSWIMPLYEQDNDALDALSSSQSYYLSDSTFNIGQPLRGSNAIADGNGSIGTLCQRQFNDGTTDQNMIDNSDLCLFQWGHPAGVYISGGGGSLNDQALFEYDIKIRGRELISSGAGLFDVVMIYRADTGAEIDITVDSTGTTHNQALTGGASTYKEVILSDVPFDGSGDELTISFLVSDTVAVEVKTLAIFEKTF